LFTWPMWSVTRLYISNVEDEWQTWVLEIVSLLDPVHLYFPASKVTTAGLISILSNLRQMSGRVRYISVCSSRLASNMGKHVKLCFQGYTGFRIRLYDDNENIP
ncbi:unnamed protein product, partial [Meganyctiphanes norvegica]